jgi:uncharacterized membrane protein YphA (DoxX/SURF4 family)
VGPFERWLLWKLPPLSGRLRFVFYSGSLALFAFLNHGLDFTLGVASPDLYEPRGVTGLLDLPYLSPTATRMLMAGLYAAWLCAAVGLLTRAAKITTAVLMFVAVGLEQAYEIASNHTHYLLLYSLVLLCFTTSDRDWSVDDWLSRRRRVRGPRPAERSGLGETGLARHILLVLVVAIYWSAGVSKLVDAGLAWADGSSLQYYIGAQVDRTSFDFIRSLRSSVAGQLWLCRVFAVASLGLELASPLALLSRRLRHLFIPAWVSMHVAIALLMNPNYWIHSWCLVILLTDWGWVRRLWLASFRPEAPPRSEPTLGTTGPRHHRVVALGALLLALPFVPALLQVEWFPVTHVPMYGSYMAPGVVGGIPEADFGIEGRVREIARSCAGSRTIGYIRRCSWRIPRYLSDRLSLELRGPDRPSVLFSGEVDRLRYALIAHLAAPAGGVGEADTAAELERRVRALLAAASPGSQDGYDSFTLRYRLNEGALTLLSGRLEPDG